MIVISSERFAEHQTPPGHPESPARADVMDAVAREWRERGGEVVAPRAATAEHILRVHDAAHLARIQESAGRAVAFDPDTYTSPESSEIALLAAGACVDAVERVMGGSHRRALVLVRPPGHHAERSRAMGFCLYNNVAVAAAHARALGAGRVAIVDYDVHHGNGTQRIFQDDPSVLYVSTHQYPAYPGTGASGEVGDGSGAGFTVNLPVEAGAVDEDYRLVFREIVAPVIGQFKPDLLLVSAGFDAHEQDPLAGMRLTTPAFPGMTAELARLADESCDGRMAVVTEGGYNLGAFAESLRGVMNVLGAGRTPAPEWPAPTPVTSIRGRRTADEAKRVLSPYWRF